MGAQPSHRVLAGVVVLLVGVAAGAAGALLATGTPSSASAAGEGATSPPAREIAAGYLPQFTGDGKLRRPEGWESWVLAGTSMGLSYDEPQSAPEPGDPPGMFLNVYIQPWAYEEFMESGEFPENTMFILSGSEPVRKADPARAGFYQGPIHLMEVHLKKEGIDPSGWAFFGFGGGTDAADKIPHEASCYTCHAEDAAFDQAFVQFYPKIRERLGMEAPAEGDE